MEQAVYAILELAAPVLKEKQPVLIAIDGRSAAGKSTLAAQLEKALGWQVIHMDDFFLRPDQRTPQRLGEPGGNVDYERFLEEVLLPLSRGEAVLYRPYDCHTQSFRTPSILAPSRVVVVEGAYSCHPKLREYYDLRVFLSEDREEQARRIRQEQRCFSKNGSLWRNGTSVIAKCRSAASFSWDKMRTFNSQQNGRS